ncbi:MAG: TolC family protein [Acidobacteriaceae bacterium]|nr:TolC family protein [Acidobacteriaceae bacterium]
MSVYVKLKHVVPILLSILSITRVSAQQPVTAAVTISLADALQRARQYGAQIQAANIATQLAHEDRVQARAASLPNVSGLNQFIYTEGNGTPSGVFVANDGVHVYNEQLNAHEELLSFVRRGEIRAAAAAEAVARAKADVAGRGLVLTVVSDYYGIVNAQRKIKNAQASLAQAQQFLDITQKQEQGGEVAHADVIKAQIQLQQRQRDIQDAQLVFDKAKITLAVLIFPRLQLDYDVVDDLSDIKLPPPVPEAGAQAATFSPDVRAAQATVNQARLGVTVARYAYLPSFALDVWYGIDANQFAARTDYSTQATGRSTLPNYQVPYRQNLGYVAQATLNIPLWNWGSIHSKVKQAALKQQQAELDLTTTQKQLQADLATAHREAELALAQIQSLRESSDLASESLRLTLLRYQAGESTALEVVDAQTTAAQSRSAYDDGLLRYRVALANLQNLAGTL